MNDTTITDTTVSDAKPWYLSKTILTGIVGLALSALAAFKIVLPAAWGADEIVNFLLTAIPIVLMIAAHWTSTATVTSSQAKADVLNAAASEVKAIVANATPLDLTAAKVVDPAAPLPGQGN